LTGSTELSRQNVSSLGLSEMKTDGIETIFTNVRNRTEKDRS
jgi:hypothetical protein